MQTWENYSDCRITRQYCGDVKSFVKQFLNFFSFFRDDAQKNYTVFINEHYPHVFINISVSCITKIQPHIILINGDMGHIVKRVQQKVASWCARFRLLR